jgi:hypothetical protein
LREGCFEEGFWLIQESNSKIQNSKIHSVCDWWELIQNKTNLNSHTCQHQHNMHTSRLSLTHSWYILQITSTILHLTS